MSDNNPSTPKTGGIFSKTHPMIIVAAGAVTLFCAVGIGVMTGLIPSANSNSSTNNSSAPALTAATSSMAMAPVGSVDSAALPAIKTDLKPVESTTVGQPLAKQEAAQKKVEPHKAPAPKTTSTKPVDAPVPVYAQNDKPTERAPVIVASAPPTICRNCGTVDSITPIEKKGEGSGAGAVVGGLLGGVIGHQVGGGRGRDVATVAGAVGGALAGNAIEKNSKTAVSYDVRVRLEDNTFQTVRYETEPGVRVGDKVKIESGRVVRN